MIFVAVLSCNDGFNIYILDTIKNEPEILQQFYEYATSSSGGNKPRSVVRQYVHQIKKCLVVLHPALELTEIFKTGMAYISSCCSCFGCFDIE